MNQTNEKSVIEYIQKKEYQKMKIKRNQNKKCKEELKELMIEFLISIFSNPIQFLNRIFYRNSIFQGIPNIEIPKEEEFK